MWKETVYTYKVNDSWYHSKKSGWGRCILCQKDKRVNFLLFLRRVLSFTVVFHKLLQRRHLIFCTLMWSISKCNLTQILHQENIMITYTSLNWSVHLFHFSGSVWKLSIHTSSDCFWSRMSQLGPFCGKCRHEIEWSSSDPIA